MHPCLHSVQALHSVNVIYSVNVLCVERKLEAENQELRQQAEAISTMHKKVGACMLYMVSASVLTKSIHVTFHRTKIPNLEAG